MSEQVPSGDLLFPVHVVPSGDLLGVCRGFEFFSMHFVPSGDLLHRWICRVHFFLPIWEHLGWWFFRMLVLPGGNLHGGWFIRVHGVSSRDDLCFVE